MPALPNWLQEMAEKDVSQDAKDKQERNLRWINEFSDSLSVAIALRDWDEAVSLVETGRDERPLNGKTLVSSFGLRRRKNCRHSFLVRETDSAEGFAQSLASDDIGRSDSSQSRCRPSLVSSYTPWCRNRCKNNVSIHTNRITQEANEDDLV